MSTRDTMVTHHRRSRGIPRGSGNDVMVELYDPHTDRTTQNIIAAGSFVLDLDDNRRDGRYVDFAGEVLKESRQGSITAQAFVWLLTALCTPGLLGTGCVPEPEPDLETSETSRPALLGAPCGLSTCTFYVSATNPPGTPAGFNRDKFCTGTRAGYENIDGNIEDCPLKSLHGLVTDSNAGGERRRLSTLMAYGLAGATIELAAGTYDAFPGSVEVNTLSPAFGSDSLRLRGIGSNSAQVTVLRAAPGAAVTLQSGPCPSTCTVPSESAGDLSLSPCCPKRGSPNPAAPVNAPAIEDTIGVSGKWVRVEGMTIYAGIDDGIQLDEYIDGNGQFPEVTTERYIINNKIVGRNPYTLPGFPDTYSANELIKCTQSPPNQQYYPTHPDRKLFGPTYIIGNEFSNASSQSLDCTGAHEFFVEDNWAHDSQTVNGTHAGGMGGKAGITDHVYRHNWLKNSGGVGAGGTASSCARATFPIDFGQRSVPKRPGSCYMKFDAQNILFENNHIEDAATAFGIDSCKDCAIRGNVAVNVTKNVGDLFQSAAGLEIKDAPQCCNGGVNPSCARTDLDCEAPRTVAQCCADLVTYPAGPTTNLSFARNTLSLARQWSDPNTQQGQMMMSYDPHGTADGAHLNATMTRNRFCMPSPNTYTNAATDAPWFLSIRGTFQSPWTIFATQIWSQSANEVDNHSTAASDACVLQHTSYRCNLVPTEAGATILDAPATGVSCKTSQNGASYVTRTCGSSAALSTTGGRHAFSLHTEPTASPMGASSCGLTYNITAPGKGSGCMVAVDLSSSTLSWNSPDGESCKLNYDGKTPITSSGCGGSMPMPAGITTPGSHIVRLAVNAGTNGATTCSTTFYVP